MAQRAKILRRLKPIDLPEAQCDHHDLGKGKFELRGQALRADKRGVLFQKREHGLVRLQEREPRAAYSVPGLRKLPTNDFSCRLGSQIAYRTRAFVPGRMAGPKGILPSD
jgi:hypothetical protein